MEQIKHTNSASIVNEARNKVRMKNFNEALALYEKAINSDAVNYNAYAGLGALYERLNDNEKAKDIYLQGINKARTFNNVTAEKDLSFTLLGLIELSF